MRTITSFSYNYGKEPMYSLLKVLTTGAVYIVAFFIGLGIYLAYNGLFNFTKDAPGLLLLAVLPLYHLSRVMYVTRVLRRGEGFTFDRDADSVFHNTERACALTSLTRVELRFPFHKLALKSSFYNRVRPNGVCWDQWPEVWLILQGGKAICVLRTAMFVDVCPAGRSLDVQKSVRQEAVDVALRIANFAHAGVYDNTLITEKNFG